MMSIKIYYLSKEILDIKNITFDSLHKKILEIVQAQKMRLPKNLSQLIDQLDQDIWGLGNINVDVSNYLKSKEELNLFAKILKQAIDDENREYPYARETLEKLMKFYNEIFKYADLDLPEE